ncbi:hypothetical protein HYT05_01415 [Candidatus Kaiserbacteria bacterium]|nr:hypothetical protein [Candidatus Kaiserbacteria bacterium]
METPVLIIEEKAPAGEASGQVTIRNVGTELWERFDDFPPFRMQLWLLLQGGKVTCEEMAAFLHNTGSDGAATRDLFERRSALATQRSEDYDIHDFVRERAGECHPDTSEG